MRKILILLMLAMFSTSTVFAATEDIVEGMGKKAVRGAVNIVTGPIEFPAQIIKGFQKGVEPIENQFFSKTIGTILGIFRGISHGVGRMSWGFLELAGFWTANPDDNDGVGVPLDAEYAWEEGVQYSIFDPSLEEGIKPIGRKLGRGLGNGLFAIAELPGQTIRGASEGNVFKGVIRGFWFGASRMAYGFTGVTTALVPNPPDNPGYAFNGEWPWTVFSEEMED
ncbi:MAG TPA: hypothetical protein VI749_07980 [Candidatus Omnitrophota bacterium]|nr:hypothetical protein [Candidatus Omnitrophota bacterium]